MQPQTIRKHLKNKKGFTLLELLVTLMVLSIILAIAVPSYGNVREKAKEQACERQRELIERNYSLYKASGGTVALANIFSDTPLEFPLDLTEATCPSGGEFFVEEGEILCSVHSGEISGEEPGDSGTPADPPAGTYPGTSVSIQESPWPRQEQFSSDWEQLTLKPSGIFQHTDGNHYVISREMKLNRPQASTGPGGDLLNWYVTHRITGKVHSFPEESPGNGSAGGFVRGDMAEVGGDYYVFVDGGTWAAHPKSNQGRGQWYKVP